MKTDRKIKTEKAPPKLKSAKSVRRVTPKTNGKHPLASYEHIPIGIVECSPEGKYVGVNEEFCRITGYTRSELLQRGIKDLTHDDDYSIDLKLHERLVAGKIPFYRLEKLYLRKDGGSIWVELTRSVIRDEEGKPVYTIGVVLDISERKHVERVLRDSVERLRLATASANMFMWEWDFQNQSYVLADNFEQVLGFPTNLLPKNNFETIQSLVPTEDIQRFAAAFQKAIENHKDLPSLPCRVINPENGQIVWLEVSAKIVYDYEGQPERMFGVAQNITGNKKVQDEIAIISRMPAENPNPVMRLTPDGKVLYANTASLVMLESWKLQNNQTLPADLQRHVAEAFASGLKKELEIQQNGNTLACTLAPIREAGYVNFYGNDITARKRAEEKLRESEERYRAVVESQVEMLCRFQPEGKILFVNAAYARARGTTSEALINRNFWEFIPKEDQPGVRAMLDTLTPEAPEVQIENRFQTTDGERWILWTNRGITFDANGKLLEAQSSGIDITERKQAEKRLALLADVSEILRNIEDPYELMYAISQAIGEQLHAKRVLFNEIDLEHHREVIHRDYHNGLESVAGIHKISEYSSLTSAEVAVGRTVVNRDSKTDPRTAADYEKVYALSKERSYVVVPMMRENRWVASLWVSDDVPRHWSSEEVALLETVAERTWTVIEKLRINAALRESEERLRATLDTTVVGFATLTTDTRFIDVNDAFCQIVGYPREELLGMDCSLLTHPDYLESTNNHVAQLLAGEIPSFVLEKIYIRKDGAHIWVQNSVSMTRDTDGKPLSLIVICQDVTERKHAEEALRGSEERYRGIVNQTIGGIAETDLTGKYIMVNDRYCEITGYTPEKLLNEMRMQDITHPDDLQKNQELFGRLTTDGTSFEMEKRYIRPDGSMVWVHNSVSAITNADGKPQSAVAVVIDVTERKRIEEALRMENERFMRFVNSNIVGILIGKASGEVVLANDYYLRLLGVSRQEFMQGKVNWKKFTPPEWLSADEKAIRELRERGVCEPYEKEYIRTDGTRVPVYIADALLSGPGEEIAAFVIDITERKRAEEALRESEALYRTIARSIPDGGVYVVDKDFRYLVAEGPVTEAFGLSREMLEGHTVSEVFPDDRGARMEDRLRRNFAGETVGFETEFNGRVYWTQQAPLLDSIGQAIILTLDITERKRAEEALRQSDERFAQFMQHLPGLAWIKDMQGRYVYANAAAEKAFNTPREKLYGKTDEEIFPLKVAAQFKDNDQRALLEGQGVQAVETLEQADGVLHFSLVSKFPIPGSDGNPALVGGTAFDITERLQAEEALRESEERFSAILRQATAGIVRKDAEGKLIFVNQAFCNMLGYTEEELVGKTIWDFIHPEDIAENKRSYDRLMAEGIPFKLERRLLREDGSVIWVDASVSPIMDASGSPQSAVAVEVDITGRKQAEEALRDLNLQLEDRVLSRTAKLRAVNQTLREEIAERKRVEEALRQSEATARNNEEKLRTLFDLLPVGISFLDTKGQIVQMNSALPNILKLSKEQLLSQAYKPRKYIRADGRPMSPAEFANARALAEEKTIYNVETGILLENGEVVWTNVSAAPVDVAEVGTVVVTVDITDSKRAERALQESHRRLRILSQRLVEVQEDERRALARELHDRVGQTLAALNINLIIINSQLSGEAVEQIGTRLNDSMKLVAETIALVRDVMTDLRPSVLDDYGLEAALESHLAQFISRYNISVRLEKPNQPLPRLGPSIEMTFLRIAQEALMNIARHAQATQVKLTLRREGDAACLTIQDNGVGIESWQEANRPGSHGLTIMRERAEAFDGNLKVRSVPGQGTVVEVTIPFTSDGQNESREKKDL